MALIEGCGQKMVLWGSVGVVKRRRRPGRGRRGEACGGEDGEGGDLPLGASGAVPSGRSQWGFVSAGFAECFRL